MTFSNSLVNIIMFGNNGVVSGFANYLDTNASIVMNNNTISLYIQSAGGNVSGRVWQMANNSSIIISNSSLIGNISQTILSNYSGNLVGIHSSMY